MLLLYLSQWLSILPVFGGILFWKYLDKTLRVFWVYCVLMCLTEFISEIVFRWEGANMFLYPIYGLIHFMVISVVLFHFEELIKIKTYLKLAITTIFSSFFLEFFFLLKPNEMPALSMIIGSVLIILIVFKFFSELLKISSLTPLLLQPRFIIGTSLILYAGSTIFYFLLFNYLSQNKNNFNEAETEIVFFVHAFFNCVFYILNMLVFVSKWRAKISS